MSEFDHQILTGTGKGHRCKILRPAKKPGDVFVETSDGARLLLPRHEVSPICEDLAPR